MLINCIPGEECRIAIVEDGRLEEIYQERASNESHVGNVYKGKVTNVEPSIQAAFVNVGLERNGFLHITDLHPMYFPSKLREQSERVGHKTPRHGRPPIQKCLRRGQEVLVQVIKEGIGSKGPTVSSYVSIPGRYLVMMPHMERLGVSRRVEDDDARRESRKILDGLDPPPGFGFIVRTAGVGQTKTELKRDLAYLQRLWSAIEKRRKHIGEWGELYSESDLVIRTIRDVYSTQIERIIVDDPDAAKRARDFLAIASPRSASTVMLYRDRIPVFRRFGVEDQIDSANQKQVDLPSGGSLVIESTEAVVAIDVNSGKMRSNHDAETTAYKTNQEAVDEICRQLRLRDLGGVIINDLIDMDQAKHRRTIEQQFRENMKRDRARTRIAGISPFGILEMTRQRMRPSLNKSIYIECGSCHGSGSVKSAESVLLDVMRQLAAVLHLDKVARVELTISPSVAFQLLNRKRGALVELEEVYRKQVTVRVNDGGPSDFIGLTAFDERGGEVDGDDATYSDQPELHAVEDIEPAGRFDPAADAAEETEDADEPVAVTGDEAREGKAASPQTNEPGEQAAAGANGKKRTRRGRRSRKPQTKKKEIAGGEDAADGDSGAVDAADRKAPSAKVKPPAENKSAEGPADEQRGDDAKPTRKRKTRRGGRKRKSKRSAGAEQAESANASGEAQAERGEPAGDSPSRGYNNARLVPSDSSK